MDQIIVVLDKLLGVAQNNGVSGYLIMGVISLASFFGLKLAATKANATIKATVAKK